MKVLFVSSGKKGEHPSSVIKAQAFAVEKQRIFVEHFTVNKKGLMGYVKESIRLRRFLKTNGYDLVHAHYGLSGVLSLMAKGKTKLVVSFMGSDLIGSIRADRKVPMHNLILIKIHSLLAKWFYDSSIVKSKQMLNYLKITRTSLIPNGVDINVFRPLNKLKARAVLGFEPDVQILIFVSSISRREKNFKLAQKAVNLINNSKLKLITINEVSQNRLPYYYSAADVLLLTSYYEGSPNVIKEAMACNCPIVSTDVGDVKWVLGDTEGCYLASFDPEIYATKVILALEFSKEKGRTNGRDRIIELGLDSESIAKKIVEVYKNVLE